MITMRDQMHPFYKKIYDMEEELILIEGQMKVLIQVLPEGYVHGCAALILQQKLKNLHQDFYELWQSIPDNIND